MNPFPLRSRLAPLATVGLAAAVGSPAAAGRALTSEGQKLASNTYLPKADLLTFWFSGFGLFLVMTPKG